MSTAAPSIPNWVPVDSATSIAGQAIWLFRTAANIAKIPAFAAPGGYETLFPPVAGAGTRAYAAIRQLPGTIEVVKSAAPGISQNPVIPSAPLPTSSPPGPAYTVGASEVLFLTSQVSVDGVLQPRRWSFQNSDKSGYNCGFRIDPTTPAGQYVLVESEVSGESPIAHAVTVTADPYKSVTVPAGADLAALISAAPDLTRYVLAADADYVLTKQSYISRRLQLVGQTGTVVTVKPAIPAGAASWDGLFAVWLSSAATKVGLVNLTFTADTGGKLDSQGKTGTGAAYVAMGSLWAIDCTFEKMDFGIQADSTPNHQAAGILVQSCQWPDLYAQGVWIGGQHLDIDSCKGGPSRLEHPIRSSIVDLATNQLPTFVRIAGFTFDATHAGATTADPGKESAALRDGKYFYVANNTFIGWAECGQGKPGAGNYFGDYVIDGNTFEDPATAPKTGALNVRAGVNGPGLVSNNTSAMPIDVTAAVPPTLIGNKP